MKLSLGFSPCPNDCFIFDALLHQKIDTEGLSFEPVMEDVEALNRKAIGINALDISKLSFFAYAKVQKKYALLDSGAALGCRVGPLVISGNSEFKTPLSDRQIQNLKIAIPGKYTTANFLFSLVYPELKNKTEMLFSEIQDAVLEGKFDWGVIIHESRFTYKKKGLNKIIDLGEWWEKKYKSPLPLGGIFIQKTFPKIIQKKVERVIRKSVEFALKNPYSCKAFVKRHAREMEEAVIRKHIELYVNRFSVSLGKQGRKAVDLFLKHTRKCC